VIVSLVLGIPINIKVVVIHCLNSIVGVDQELETIMSYEFRQ